MKTSLVHLILFQGKSIVNNGVKKMYLAILKKMKEN